MNQIDFFGNHRIKCSALPVTYLWRSDPDPFCSETYATWQPYEEEDIEIIEKAYNKFLYHNGPPEIKLKMSKKHKVNFLLWMQVSLKNPQLQRPFKRVVNQIQDPYNEISVDELENKREEIKNFKANRNPFSLEPIENKGNLENNKPDYKKFFFWRSDADPFSSEKNAIWTPYNERDSLYLENSYKKYQTGGPPEVYLENNKYIINFQYWLQISKVNPSKQRPICRFTVKEETNNIKKISGGKESDQIKEKKLTDSAPYDMGRKLSNNNEYISFLWRVGKEKIEFLLPKDMNFFKDNQLNLTIDDYLNKLNNEVKLLSAESEYQNEMKKYDFSENFAKLKNNPSNLIQNLATLYISDNFLYSELNQLLQSYQNDLIQGFKKKYLFIGVMAAICELNEITKNLLKYEYSAGNQTMIKVFKGSVISEEELDIYKKNPNVVRQVKSFISTSMDQQVSLDFLNKKENKRVSPKAIFQYELRINGNPFFTFLNTNSQNKYGEKEILIHNEVIIQTTSIIEDRKNQFLINGKIISSGWKSFFQYVSMNPDLKELNLSSNDFGNGKIENMIFLKEALVYNKTITTLNLNNNNFGTGKIEILMILKEALLESRSITELNLNKNHFGEGGFENWKLMVEAIIENESISHVNIANNQFGIGDKEKMRLLKELLKDRKIKKINLGYNSFGVGNTENMKLLKEGVLESKCMSLDLSGNFFGKGDQKNMELLKEALVRNKYIKIFYACDNDFGQGEFENMILLSDILLENKSIIELHLDNNYFGNGNNDEMEILKEALVKNMSLKRIFLNQNNFTRKNKQKSKYLYEILQYNKNVEYLDLSGNYLDEDSSSLEIKKDFGERIQI